MPCVGTRQPRWGPLWATGVSSVVSQRVVMTAGGEKLSCDVRLLVRFLPGYRLSLRVSTDRESGCGQGPAAWGLVGATLGPYPHDPLRTARARWHADRWHADRMAACQVRGRRPRLTVAIIESHWRFREEVPAAGQTDCASVGRSAKGPRPRSSSSRVYPSVRVSRRRSCPMDRNLARRAAVPGSRRSVSIAYSLSSILLGRVMH